MISKGLEGYLNKSWQLWHVRVRTLCEEENKPLPSKFANYSFYWDTEVPDVDVFPSSSKQKPEKVMKWAINSVRHKIHYLYIKVIAFSECTSSCLNNKNHNDSDSCTSLIMASPQVKITQADLSMFLLRGSKASQLGGFMLMRQTSCVRSTHYAAWHMCTLAKNLI